MRIRVLNRADVPAMIAASSNRETIPMRRLPTIGVWTLSLVNLLFLGLIAAEFAFMATSVDPAELVTLGLEPWSNALQATSAFVALALVTVLSLVLWHTVRFRKLALFLTAAETAVVIVICAKVYVEYF